MLKILYLYKMKITQKKPTTARVFAIIIAIVGLHITTMCNINVIKKTVNQI